MRPILSTGAIVAAAAAVAPSASAAPITAVFGGAVPCLTAPPGAYAGQRFCQGAAAPYYVSPVASFDGTPIDVAVTLPPAPDSGPDGNFPTVVLLKGLGEGKSVGSETIAQRWVEQGYAVFSITPRGFLGSCGPLTGPVGSKPPACANGYSRLGSRKYEVRDIQDLLGKLADEHVVDPDRLGVYGYSYGGGIGLQLGALRNRVELTDGTLVPWRSPAGTRLSIAATGVEVAWSDLMASLQPNGSTLDYAEENPYAGPRGDARFGVQKQLISDVLFGGTALGGWFAPPGADPTADILGWKAFNDTGGPYDGQPLTADQLRYVHDRNAIDVDDSSVAPAPALLMNGWNDDLFPVSESIRYYNHVRARRPSAAISMIALNWGHPRGIGGIGGDTTGLVDRSDEWFAHYVLQDDLSDAPSWADGGVLAVPGACQGASPKRGRPFTAKDWAALSRGEVRFGGAGAQTVAPGTTPAEPFQSLTAGFCATGPSSDTAGAADYSSDPIGGNGLMVAGTPTVIADLDVTGANDQLVARLLDVNPATSQARLIGRGVLRPTVGANRRRVFQLGPQATKIEPGHVLKLELLSSDAPYVRQAVGQLPIVVRNLEIRVPTRDRPGAADGEVLREQQPVVPPGYRLVQDERDGR